MVKIHIGERVKNGREESGVITAFDNQYITVDYPSRTASVVIDAFEKGYIKYENTKLQNEVQDCIDKIELMKKQKAEEERISAEKAKAEKRALAIKTPTINTDIKFESVKTLIDPAPVYLTSVRKKDRQLVQQIFDECENDTQSLYKNFKPTMLYPKFTSRSRSKYCVGFLTKYLNAYVLRIFSRNDVYKRSKSKGITVIESNTAEVLRVLQIDGKLYHFTKNMAVSLGHYNNTIGNSKWCGSDMGANVFLNEVICNCDCGYLNGYVSDKTVNAQAFLFINLLFLALANNKAEIAFKNKAFASTYGIQNLTEYLETFTTKQIDFASKNDVIHALPFIKKFGISDIELLRDLDSAMDKRGYIDSIYSRVKRMVARFEDDLSDFDRRFMNFVKNVEHFNAAIYSDYLTELFYQPNEVRTVQDIFERNYIERHDTLLRERLRRWNESANPADVKKENEDYIKAAKELAWINREENEYFIMVPKTIDDFKNEGDAQHNCVYRLKYYRKVIDHKSIIVFLRKEKEESYVTIEYDYNTFKVLQALGKFNKKIDPDLYQYIVQLGKQLYYEKHTNQ